MKIIICGGREYKDSAYIWRQLGLYHERFGITEEVDGDCRGADRIGGAWAEYYDIPRTPCPVTTEDWDTHGKKAGNMRNQYMLETHRPDVVLAFPGGPGTSHMKKISKKAGVEVVVFDGIKDWEPSAMERLIRDNGAGQ